MKPPVSREVGHFERLYAQNPDPWDFAGSEYEQAKYEVTLAALGERTFNHAFEAGCSIGVLTARLAPRCARLLAADIAPAAVAAARARCAGLAQVEIARLSLPADWPAGEFDLILLSEILYFLSPADVARMARHCTRSLAPGGLVLLVNYTGVTDDPCSGDEAAECFAAAAPALRRRLHTRRERFRLDLFG